jgi:methylmalonyl-CoA/ethylmalonyl-CoA epimerase
MGLYKFDHIGVVVDDLDAALDHFRQLFDVRDEDLVYHKGDYADPNPDTGTEEVMDFLLFPVGQVWFELIQPRGDGPVMRFLERTGGGLHHIGVTSDDIVEEWRKHNAIRERIGRVENRPRVDMFNVSYWYLHPKSNYNVLFEVDAPWTKTVFSNMTPLYPTPDWDSLDLDAAPSASTQTRGAIPGGQ